MSRGLTLAGFAVIGVALAAYQLTGVLGRRTATIGDVVALVARRRTGRALVLAGWLWLGWHVFVRSHVG